MNLRSAFDDEALQIEQLEPELRREVLSAYLDDELSPEAAKHVTAWLEEHPDALREVEHDRRVWDLLDLYEDEPVPKAFAPRVFEALGIERRETGRGKVIAMRPSVLAAAAVFLVAFGAFLFWSVSGMGLVPAPNGTGPETSGVAETEGELPVEYLEEVDVILALSDDEFQGYLMADLEESWEDG